MAQSTHCCLSALREADLRGLRYTTMTRRSSTSLEAAMLIARLHAAIAAPRHNPWSVDVMGPSLAAEYIVSLRRAIPRPLL